LLSIGPCSSEDTTQEGEYGIHKNILVTSSYFLHSS